MKYFVVERRFDMGEACSLTDYRPRTETRERKRDVIEVLALSELGEGSTLAELTDLWNRGKLRGSAFVIAQKGKADV